MLKVPLTAQNILLDTLPKVHKSGQNSPNSKEKVPSTSGEASSKEKLEEKLLLASVSNAVIAESEDAADRARRIDTSIEDLVTDPLLEGTRGYPRPFGAPKPDYLDMCGSDCEMNWVVLLFCILAICVIVPLIYVYVAYEHPEEFAKHSRYDDTDLHQLHHFDDNKHNITHNSTNRP